MSGGCLVRMLEVDPFCFHSDPSIVQLIGASRSTASIPFQVFHMPGDQVEILEDWLKRTLSSNPVETIYGLYDMVCRSTCGIVHH